MAYKHIFAVGTSAGIDKRPSVPLRDVFMCEEWQREFDSHCGGKDLHLIRFKSFDEFASIPGTKALSYRWSKVLKVVCGVRTPGEKQSSPRKCSLAVDAFRALQKLDSGYLWVDFLCHLDHPFHKVSVIDNMSPVYCDTEVICLYLTDFCRYSQQSRADAKIKDKHKHKVMSAPLRIYRSPKSIGQDACLEALRRGWIQQEVSFGRLNTDIVSEFVRECVACSRFGLLGTLLRRRAVALGWLLSSSKAVASFSDLAFFEDLESPKQDKANAMGLNLWNIADLNDTDHAFDDDDTIREFLRLPPPDASGLLHCSPDKGVSSEVAGAIVNIVARTLRDSGKFPEESKSFYSLQNKQFIFKCFRDDNKTKAMLALGPFMTQMSSMLCEPQPFNASDPFCAFQLLRSFGESAIGFEEDALPAMTQCAARSAGMAWVPGRSTQAAMENFATLRACWKTVVWSAVTQTQEYRWRMSRAEPLMWTAGLGDIPQLTAQLAKTVKPPKQPTSAPHSTAGGASAAPSSSVAYADAAPALPPAMVSGHAIPPVPPTKAVGYPTPPERSTTPAAPPPPSAPRRQHPNVFRAKSKEGKEMSFLICTQKPKATVGFRIEGGRVAEIFVSHRIPPEPDLTVQTIEHIWDPHTKTIADQNQKIMRK